jgi:hypothetical protein
MQEETYLERLRHGHSGSGLRVNSILAQNIYIRQQYSYILGEKGKPPNQKIGEVFLGVGVLVGANTFQIRTDFDIDPQKW